MGHTSHTHFMSLSFHSARAVNGTKAGGMSTLDNYSSLTDTYILYSVDVFTCTHIPCRPYLPPCSVEEGLGTRLLASHDYYLNYK